MNKTLGKSLHSPAMTAVLAAQFFSALADNAADRAGQTANTSAPSLFGAEKKRETLEDER